MKDTFSCHERPYLSLMHVMEDVFCLYCLSAYFVMNDFPIDLLSFASRYCLDPYLMLVSYSRQVDIP
jgi:hypothetical protein